MPHGRRGDAAGARGRGEPGGPSFRRRVLRRVGRHRRRRRPTRSWSIAGCAPCNRSRGSAMRKGSMARRKSRFRPAGPRCSTSWRAACPCNCRGPVRTILRSGCYVTHDSGFYERFLRHVIARSGAPWREREGLKPALEVWTQVQSRPEPGLAILAFGKRDASFDLEMPVPFARVRDGVRTPLDANWRIGKLNDQHAYCRFRPTPTCVSATSSAAGFRTLHDVRQVALDARRRRRLRRHRRHPDFFLTGTGAIFSGRPSTLRP